MSDDADRRTEASVLTDRLRDEIVRGDAVPGSKLKLVPLARRFAVSRGPLREAVSRLAAEGLVTIEDQRGFRVAPVSRDDLLDLTRTRQRVEELALRDSIEAGDLAWEGRVMATCHMLARVTAQDGAEAGRAPFVAQHRAFHEALVSACTSTYLLDFRARLYAHAERYRNLAARRYRAGEGRDIAAEHLALAEAVVSRDADRACDIMREHIGETAQTLLDDWPADAAAAEGA